MPLKQARNDAHLDVRARGKVCRAAAASGKQLLVVPEK